MSRVKNLRHIKQFLGAVVVAQLVEQLFPTPEVRGLNPVISKIYLLSQLHLKLRWKYENKDKKRPEKAFYVIALKVLEAKILELFGAVWRKLEINESRNLN